jgi:hypothetical protein
MAMKTGMVALGALAVVIAGGAMTGEPRGMQGYELELEGDTHVPCNGEFIHDFGSITGLMLQLRYDYKLAVHAAGGLVVYRKSPPTDDWTRCIGPSH